MKISSRELKFPISLVALMLLALLWLYAIGWALIGYPLFRDQHLGAAIVYAQDGVDLLRPTIVGFNANGAGTPQEFPLWQAAAGLAIRAASGWWGAANLVSLTLFTACLPGLFLAAKWEIEDTGAWLTLALLLAQPIVFHFAGMAGTDGFSLALLFGFIGCSEWLRHRPSPTAWVACSAVAILLGITKLPFLMAGGIAASLMLLWGKQPRRSWFALILAGVVACCVFYIWNRWCEAEIGRAEFRYRPLMLKEIPHWFFGTIAMRLDPAIYVKSGWKALSCLWGSFIAVGVTIYGLWIRPKSLGSALLLAALTVTMIFFNLITTHRHYYLMFAPAVALLNAYAIKDICNRLPLQTLLKSFGVAIALSVLLLLSLAQGLVSIEAAAAADPFPVRAAKQLAEHSLENEKILVVNGGWGGDILIRARRNGLSADDTKLIENPNTRRQLMDLGYTKIAVVSGSPLIHALQVTNPGSAGLKSITWKNMLSASASNWPRVFESDDLVILEIQ